MIDKTGRCPLCDTPGEVGLLCGERICKQNGYHFIPDEYYRKLQTKKRKARDQQIGLRIDDYLVVDEIGFGGFGKVYLSLQMPVQMRAALKLLNRNVGDNIDGQTLIKKFEGEAISLARLNHPNIVRLLKYGTFLDMPYLVMEYVEDGRTLKEEITERVFIGGGLELDVVRHILEQILNALACAHGRQIVHRDIKPENIMLQRVAGDNYLVRVLDFGLAKFVEDRAQTSLAAGTPSYMAPEQIVGKNLGAWTDLYAVGVIAFEMLTGKRPFEGQRKQDIYAKKLDPTYEPLSVVEGLNLPTPVQSFLSKSIARAVSQRFQSVEEFRDGLQRAFAALDDSSPMSTTDLSNLLDSSDMMQYSVLRRKLLEKRGRPGSSSHESEPGEQDRLATVRERVSSDDGLVLGTTPRPESEPGLEWDEEKRPSATRSARAERPGSPLRWIVPLALVALLALALAFTQPWKDSSRTGASKRGTSRLRANNGPTEPRPEPLAPKTAAPQPKPVTSVATITASPTKVVPPTVKKPDPPKPVQVSVDTIPTGAELYLENKKLGTTPMKWTTEASPKSMTLTIRKSGYKQQEVIILLDQSRPPYTFKLEELEQPKKLKPVSKHKRKPKGKEAIEILRPR